jgi:hypothetical protein
MKRRGCTYKIDYFLQKIAYFRIKRMAIPSIYIDKWVQPNEAVDTSSLSAGDGVKLRNGFGETFWVKFEGVFDEGIFDEGIFDEEYLFGKVDNHLYNESEYNYGDYVVFRASDVRAISNDQTRQAQLAHVVQIIKLFEIEMGRLPTVEELDILSTRRP